MNHMEHWSEYLESVTFSINNRVRDATKYSAFELMFGRKARLPIEAESVGNLNCRAVIVGKNVYFGALLENLSK